MRCPEALVLGDKGWVADTAGAELEKEGTTIDIMVKGGVRYARL